MIRRRRRAREVGNTVGKEREGALKERGEEKSESEQENLQKQS